MSSNISIEGIEGFYLSFFDKLDAAVYTLDSEGRFLHISPAIERITGRTFEDLKGEAFRDIVCSEDREVVDRIVMGPQGEAAAHELRIIHRDSSETRCIVAARRIVASGGATLIGIIGKIRECGNLQAYDPETEEKMRKFSFAVEHSPATVVITDNQGAIEYVNPKFTSLTGYRFDEVRGQNPRILKSGKQPSGFYKELWKTISSGREWRGEFHNRKKNDDLYWESASISPIFDRAGGITHYIAVKEDITERKSAEEALRISEERLREKNFSMEREIRYARTVVERLLPGKPPVHKNLAVEFHYNPMSAIGGDFFSFNNAMERGLGVFIGDLAGHGVSAALFLSLIKSITDRLNDIHGADPVLYLKRLNNELYQSSGLFFMTALYGYFDFSNNGAAFTFAQGGHPPPVLYRAEDDTARQLISDGIPIGIAQVAGFEEVALNLVPGDRVFLYTDGITEARDENKEMIGPEGLERIISRTGGMSLRESLVYIIDEVRRFRGSEPAEDDLLLIGFETLRPDEV
jgi:sigma-B regulation protein RsbU (phosphoserine phosphatase)